MSGRIISDPDGILILGGGDASVADVHRALTHVGAVVCADGGAHLARAAEVLPAAVVGDFDSLSAEDRAHFAPETLWQNDDQDTTDFQKCLAVSEAPVVLAVGMLGGRLDHQLAAISAILREPRPVFLIGAGEVTCNLPMSFTMPLPPWTAVSLYPMRPTRVTARGLVWPLSGTTMAPDGLIGTSNRMLGDTLEVDTDGPGVLLTVPEAHLGALITAFAARAR